MSQFMLPGSTAVVRRKAPFGLLMVLVVLIGAAVCAYLLSQGPAQASPVQESAETSRPTAQSTDPANDEGLEDISNHVQHAKDGIADNVNKIKRAQARIEQVLPLLEQTDLSMYKTRLQ